MITTMVRTAEAPVPGVRTTRFPITAAGAGTLKVVVRILAEDPRDGEGEARVFR